MNIKEQFALAYRASRCTLRASGGGRNVLAAAKAMGVERNPEPAQSWWWHIKWAHVHIKKAMDLNNDLRGQEALLDAMFLDEFSSKAEEQKRKERKTVEDRIRYLRAERQRFIHEASAKLAYANHLRMGYAFNRVTGRSLLLSANNGFRPEVDLDPEDSPMWDYCLTHGTLLGYRKYMKKAA